MIINFEEKVNEQMNQVEIPKHLLKPPKNLFPPKKAMNRGMKADAEQGCFWKIAMPVEIYRALKVLENSRVLKIKIQASQSQHAKLLQTYDFLGYRYPGFQNPRARSLNCSPNSDHGKKLGKRRCRDGSQGIYYLS